jgi:putative molybdopterin biosynthesis protein
MSQEQFLDVIDRDEAERRFREAIELRPLGTERVSLDHALGRVLAEDVVAEIDVPSFDRSNYDGYAVRAADTYGAQEETPRRLKLTPEVLATGVIPEGQVGRGTAMAIATGGMLPRGADAVVMVEHTEVELPPPLPQPSPGGTEGRVLLVTKAVTPGFGVSFAGTDLSAGETVLRRGQLLTSRETGVLAAIGASEVAVWRRPKVAILSTGDELIEPGQPMRPGLVYDSNARILADAVDQLGAEPIRLGIVHDDLGQLRARLGEALELADVILLSGGTSKGAGDLSYRVVSELSEPGIVVHGVALKPGKPLCLAGHRGKPVVILPGFPTSAIFTFHEFVAPVIRTLGGRSTLPHATVEARLPVKVNSEIGRTEYLLVGLVDGPEGWAAYPMGKGSGSVTTFSQADGFVTIGRQEEILDAGSPVAVQLLGSRLRLADLVVIGSHCVGLDMLLGKLHDRGLQTKFLAVGSTGGLQAAARGECDLAGVHLLDPETGRYNVHLITDDLKLVEGYGRVQGVVYRPGDRRFEGTWRGERGGGRGESFSPLAPRPSPLAPRPSPLAPRPSSLVAPVEIIARIKDDPDCVMVNRNRGSGTRILIDRLLQGVEPTGYAVQPRSHNAVAAAVSQGRADWGVAIEWVARRANLGFIPVEEERYDFLIPKARWDRPAVVAFRRLLGEPAVREELRRMGFHTESRSQA